MSRGQFIVLFPLVGLLLSSSTLSHATSDQTVAPSSVVWPQATTLSDVEIRLDFQTSGGCVGRCIKYRVVVRGEGAVEYEDLGGEPRDRPQTRSIPIDEVVSLVNEFARARFFDARARYENVPVIMRDGNSIRSLLSGGIDGPEWDLTLRLGSRVKTVHLYAGFPVEIGRLRDLVEQLGGPKAWTAK